MTWASDGMNDELFISILAVLDAFLAQQIIVQIVDTMFFVRIKKIEVNFLGKRFFWSNPSCWLAF